MGLNIGKKYDARVTIWEILKNEKGAKSVRAKFTTSGKNMDGQWETDRMLTAISLPIVTENRSIHIILMLMCLALLSQTIQITFPPMSQLAKRIHRL